MRLSDKLLESHDARRTMRYLVLQSILPKPVLKIKKNCTRNQLAKRLYENGSFANFSKDVSRYQTKGGIGTKQRLTWCTQYFPNDPERSKNELGLGRDPADEVFV